jgi:formylglycine-generating enzyme required for sulfatase activity
MTRLIRACPIRAFSLITGKEIRSGLNTSMLTEEWNAPNLKTLLERVPKSIAFVEIGGKFTEKAPEGIRPFAISLTPVTWEQWEVFETAKSLQLVPRPSYEVAADDPVVEANYYDASMFARWLTLRINRAFSLPSEDEWELSANGPGKYARKYAWGDRKPHRDFCPINCDKPGSVWAYPNGASPFGILGMNGAVWQWTRASEDFLTLNSEGRRLPLRGGAWNEQEKTNDAVKMELPTARAENVSFRVVMSLE